MAKITNRVVAVAGAGVLALAGTLLPSLKGTEAIKKHEDVRYAAYYDAVQVPTICYGSTRDVYIGQRADPQECDKRLREDLMVAHRGVVRSVKRPITQSQYDALVSFTFNVGTSALHNSTLVRKLNAGDCLGAAREFSRWDKATKPNGTVVVLRGLTTRRADERRMFEQGCSAW